MSKKTLIALALSICCAMPHASLKAAEGVTDSSCDIDEMMDKNRRKMDEMAVGIYEQNLIKPMQAQIEGAPNVKDASCLPILDTMDTLIRLRIPSIGGMMGGLMAKIRDMACKYANDFIAGVVGKLNFNVSDPYGIASVGVGGTTDGSGGVQADRYDFAKVVQDAVTKAAKDKVLEYAKEASKSAVGSLPNAASDRKPRVEQKINDGVKDAFNGL